MSTWRKLAALFATLLLVAGLAACGDDDDDTAAGATTTAADDHDMPTDGEDGPPEVNPCAEGVDPAEAGLPPAEEPADGATAATITARDYEFEGVDALEAGGSFAVTFENEGAELHELMIMSIDESETRTVEELLASEEDPDTVSPVSFGFACPGDDTVVNVDLAPGRYVAICFIPVGTTPQTDPADFEEDGTPHAENGMVHEFIVS
ncbi:MAG TPA: hypothetical protein VM262_05970 [Acidimicrobiales bacterium]|nr:hypothetical protein [Acidimicrobiales bacterium]